MEVWEDGWAPPEGGGAAGGESNPGLVERTVCFVEKSKVGIVPLGQSMGERLGWTLGLYGPPTILRDGRRVLAPCYRRQGFALQPTLGLLLCTETGMIEL